MGNESRTTTARSVLTALALGALGWCGTGCASTGQETVDSAEEAFDALVVALRENDRGDVEDILGPEAKELIDSGDAVSDRNDVESFLAAFDRRHDVVIENASMATLVVGEDDWPMPIPVVAVDGEWRFDTESGKEEILARRIGENELSVIRVCQAIVDAQREYAQAPPPGPKGVHYFAQKFISSPGARDGLYWETKEGEAPSPLGPLVADAVEEGYAGAAREGRPFHGYHYRMLTSQGPSAPGGARSYLDGDRMTGGFAAIAWPAVYDNSGVMTFLVSDHGVVYQKDLGADSARLAAEIKSFDPGEGWDVVVD
jgi:hypothetical protein